MECPACSGKKGSTHQKNAQVHVCEGCNAIFSETIYLGDSYGLVRPYFSKDVDCQNARYFDFTCVGSEGLTRRHGWYNPADGCVVQVG